MNTTFEKETFYRSKNCKCKAIIYIDNNNVIRLIKGSTIVPDRIDADKNPGIADKADWLTKEMVVLNSLDTPVPYRLEIIETHKFVTIESVTQAVTGKDDVNPADYWESVFK